MLRRAFPMTSLLGLLLIFVSGSANLGRISPKEVGEACSRVGPAFGCSGTSPSYSPLS